MSLGNIRVMSGTSGFAYKSWRGGFYPDSLRQADWLSHYADNLSAVEINNTFYRLPKREVVESWAAQVPESFRFAIKASRRITHFSRLRGVGDTMQYMFSTIGALGDRLGAVLFQLPPNLSSDLGLLRDFLAHLPRDVRAALEFRHQSWFTDGVFAALADQNVALCLTDHDERAANAPTEIATADWGYVRLRRNDYDDKALRGQLERIESNGWKETFVFFKHDDDEHPLRAIDLATRTSQLPTS